MISIVSLYAYLFHRLLDMKIFSFAHSTRGLSVQMERPKIYVKCNCSFQVPTWLVPNEKCATKIVKIATKRDYSDQQNIIFLLSKWIEMQNLFRHVSNLQSCLKWCFCFSFRGSWQKDWSNATLLKLLPKSSKMLSKNWIVIIATHLLMEWNHVEKL